MLAYRNPLIATPSRPLPARVAIVGAGTIGPDIGYYLKSALPELELVLVDIAQHAVDAALARLREYADKAMARGKMSASAAAATLRGVRGTTDYAELRAADWVIEAATEDLAVKHAIFARVEELVAAEALLTSNTSSLPAARIFAHLKHPERATVTHFFAPAWRNPVVEVIRARAAAPAVIEWLRWFFCTTGKVPLLTDDIECFMLDRIFDNWCNDAALCLGRASAAEIDSVATEFVQSGPFLVLNFANGNRIITEANTVQAQAEGEHYRPAPIFRSVARWETAPLGKPVSVPADSAGEVRDRLLGVLFSQTVDILDRSIGEAADLELGCRLALAFRKGPLALMRAAGEAQTAGILQRFSVRRPGMPLPRRPLADYQQFERSVLVDELDGVKIITLRRPEALNAIDDELTDEILAVIRRYEADQATAGFVITGYGPRAFSAGADIGRFPEVLGDAAAATEYARACSRLLVHLDAMRKPVVAALNGMALGGGLELAMRCSAIVAIRNSWLQFPEITLGIAPGIGAMVVPYRRWPRAAEVFHGMLRAADRLEAGTAHELGVIDALADDPASLIRRAVGRVHELAGRGRPPLDAPVAVPAFVPAAAGGRTLSREVVGIVEQAVRTAAAAPTLTDALEAGYVAFGRSACTAAAREGITAFVERRPADFAHTG